MVTLATLLADAQRRVAALRATRRTLERAAGARPPPAAWRAAFEGSRVAVIAEVKRRSPSAGAIAPALIPADHAAAYAAGGADAISVLTEPMHFGGSMDDLAAAVARVRLPVLCKDFIVDPVQLLAARAAGAAAVLLIVRALAPAHLARLMREARELGLGLLVEAHEVREVEQAADAGADIIGVNARDLETFAIRADLVPPALAAVPAGVIAIAESGIARRADVERLARAGADGILVGTAVARAADPRAAVHALCGVPRHERRRAAG